MRLLSFLTNLTRETKATSSVELGLICALIVIAMLGALKGFAEESIGMWTRVKDQSEAAINATP